MPGSKELRQTLIRELCRRGPVRSQAEIRKVLARKGFKADQATISRDVHELGLVKGPKGYALPGQKPKSAKRNPKPDLPHVLFAKAVGNLCVLKTPPGLAAPTAISLDLAEVPGVVGTIAGDDTVFVAVSDVRKARSLARHWQPGAGK